MHTDDQIHRLLISAMIAEREGNVENAGELVNIAALLHLRTFTGKSSYFGDAAPANARLTA